MKINHEIIRRRRKELGMTQKQLAELTTHNQAMVCWIEAGKYQLTNKYMPLYAKALGLSENELVIFETNNCN